MFIIIWGRKYTSHHADVIDRDIVCEQCSDPFRIRFFHAGTGVSASAMGIGDERAQRDAVERARRSFDRTVDAALPHYPCPSCGWYQRAMNAYYRQYRLSKTILGLSIALGLLVLFNLTDGLSLVRQAGFSALLHDEGWVDVILPMLGLIAGGLAASVTLKFTADLNRSAPKVTAWLAEAQPGA